MSSAPRLIVFARHPSPGSAKTRLIPALGAEGAARLQHDMTRRTLAAAGDWAARHAARVEVRYTGAPPAAMRARYGEGWAFVDQGDGDLGERLARSVSEAFAEGAGPVVVIGADCPGLTPATLDAAFASLADGDVVLGPAHDGGYYLIGLRRPVAALFAGIAWGSGSVLAQTAAAAREARLRVQALEPLCDVDTPQDLSAWHDAVPAEADRYEPARLAVTGATGCLGMRFLRHAMRHRPSLHVTALVRTASPSFRGAEFQRLLAEHAARITLIDGDLRDLRLDGPDARRLCDADGGLWHFAAATALHPRGGAARRRVWQVNDAGTGRLLELLATRDRPGPLLHVSTAYVCGRRTGRVYEETLDDARGFRNAYEASKWSAELRVREAMGAGLSGAIFRPAVVLGGAPSGPGGWKGVDHVGDAILAAARRRRRELRLRLPPGAAVNAVHVDWVVRGLLALAGSRDGRTFHLTARQNLRLSDLAAAVARVVPGFRVTFEPDAEPSSLSGACRAADKSLSPFRDYLEAGPAVTFDRGNFDRRAATPALEPELDLDALVRSRLAAMEPQNGNDVAPCRPAAPSPGTPGEGRGEGPTETEDGAHFPAGPHPIPLPEYRERGPERGCA